MPRSAPTPFLGGHDRAPRRPGFGTGELAKCVIIMIEEVLSVRDMPAYLHASPDLLERIGRGDITSKSTPARARRRLATRYPRLPISFIAKSAPGAGSGGMRGLLCRPPKAGRPPILRSCAAWDSCTGGLHTNRERAVLMYSEMARRKSSSHG